VQDDAVRAINDVVFFLCELAALVALGVWGWRFGVGPWRWVLLVAAPAAFVVLWGFLAAPTSSTRLSDPALIAVQLAMFLLTALALVSVDLRLWALALAVVSVAVVLLDRVLPARGGL
jgi:hypothetical protein